MNNINFLVERKIKPDEKVGLICFIILKVAKYHHKYPNLRIIVLTQLKDGVLMSG